MAKGHSKAHPGWKAVSKKIQRKEGVSKEVADKILGASNARASAAAKKKNPRIKRHGGKKK